jgi:hypothetical protein
MSPQDANFRPVSYTQLFKEPVPVWYVADGHTPSISDAPILELYTDKPRVNGKGWVAFRGVPIETFRAVAQNGVDVEPTDATIFCAEEDKAWEYAKPRSGSDGPGLMYALHGGYLERSFRELAGGTSPEAIAELQKTYPYRYDYPDGNLRLSRLANQNNPAYESAYGYWVPGNAREALLAIFVRGDLDEIVDALKTSLDGSRST